MANGPWGERMTPIPLAKRLLFGLGPMALSVLLVICYVAAAVNGFLTSDSFGLVIVTGLGIGASLWAVYFLRKTSPDA